MDFIKFYASVQTALSSKKGAAMVEYALLAALIAVVAISAVSSVGTNLITKFNAISTAL